MHKLHYENVLCMNCLLKFICPILNTVWFILFFKGDSGGPMLECGAQTCFPYCLLPDCPNATIIGIHTYSHLGCTEDPAPIYPRVLDPEDETDRETKVAGYFIDVRIHVAWIKQMITANGGI